MLDQLIKLVKEHAGTAIIDNTDVPNEKNDAVINTTASGIMDHLKNLAGHGGMNNVTSLLQQGSYGNGSEVSNMSNNIASQIAKSFGIESSKAQGIVEQLIPTVINSLSNKTNDPNDDSFTMQGILGSLTSGPGGLGGMMDSFKKMF
jgi:uncharacterized protein YidB (DUF937 family)